MAAAPKTFDIINKFKKGAEQAGADFSPFPIEHLKDSTFRKESATAGASTILQNKEVKDNAKNILEQGRALAGEKVSKKTIEKAKKNLDSPTKVANITNKEQQGKSQSSLSDTFTAAAIHFTPLILGAILGGDEGIAIGGQAGLAAAQQVREDEKTAFTQEHKTRQLDQQESQFTRALQSKETQAELGRAHAEKLMGLKNSMSNRQALMKSMLKTKEGQKKLRVEGVGMALTPEDAKSLKKTKGMHSKAGRMIADLKKLRKDFGAEVFPTAEADRGNALMTQLQLLLKSPEAFQLGVLTGPDLDLLEAVTGSDPTAVFTTDAKVSSKLDELMKRLDENLTTETSLRTDPEARKARIEELRKKAGK